MSFQHIQLQKVTTKQNYNLKLNHSESTDGQLFCTAVLAAHCLGNLWALETKELKQQRFVV